MSIVGAGAGVGFGGGTGFPDSPYTLSLSATVLQRYRADNVTLVGGTAVSEMIDMISGTTANKLIQGTAARRPEWKANDANFGYRPSMSGNNALNQEVRRNGGSSFSAPLTWVCVFKNGLQNGGRLVGGALGTRNWEVYYEAANGRVSGYDGSVAQILYTDTALPGLPNLLAVSINDTTSTSYRLRKDGLQQIQPDLHISTATIGGIVLLSFSTADGSSWTGSVAELITLDGVLSGADWGLLCEYAEAHYGFTAPRPVICDGNSLTVGGWPALMGLGAPYAVTNHGTSGAVTQDLIDAFAAQIVPLWHNPLKPAVYLAWEIGNDLALDASAADAMTRYWTLLDMAKTAGFRVVAVDVPKRQYTAPREANRVACNAAVAAGWSSHADAFLQLSVDPAFQDITDTDWYTDQTHLTTAGYQRVADLAKPVITSLI